MYAHNGRLAAWLYVMVVAAVGAASLSCGGSSPAISDSDSGASGAGGFVTDASITPGIFGGDSGGSCLHFGAACGRAGDCCSGTCTNNACAYPTCTPDNLACTSNGNCCSQNCVNGTCAPLNPMCKTLGNNCASSAQCCSGLCSGNTCQSSSFCGQPGDACSSGADCCTGTCTIAAGGTLGTCGLTPPSGPANCGLADGQLCAGTAADGGIVRNAAGLPACGGPCCSRACAPWGPTGVLVCQPVSGCHVVGDLCTADTDCCGSAGLPGGSGKPVTCVITAPSTVGICRNPMGCKPDGDVCKLATSSCNSSCDCCAGNCENEDTCHQDNVGVPRCAPAQCVAAGGACASSASCCAGAPCVPNPTTGGTPPYVCSGTQCIAACGKCTNNADCCVGTSCITPSGSTQGVCGPCGGGGGSSSGGSSGSGSSSGTTSSSSSGGPTCALYGQSCQTAADCCTNIPCTNGRCEFPLY